MGKRLKNGKCVPELLTKKHKPDDESEKKRIEKCGGHVFKGEKKKQISFFPPKVEKNF